MHNLAFEIGFDHYRYNLPLDISRFSNTQRDDVRDGFDAARIQNVTQVKPDMYERKLLSIRDRALTKGLEVSITTGDIQEEFNKTKGVCPITKKSFTFAEHDLTDWSIDRVNNERGYCSDNIVIVSVVVNQAKSDSDLAELIKKMLACDIKEAGLTEFEWFRLVKFYYKKMSLKKPLDFCQLLQNTQTLFEHLVFLQLFRCKDIHAKRFLKQLEQYFSKQTILKAEKLATKRIYRHADIDVEVLYSSPKLYQIVQSFIAVIKKHSQDFNPLLMNCLLA
jgi:2C-methyl-D-erythritol 2,4-cyclodiphosphate synthase